MGKVSLRKGVRANGKMAKGHRVKRIREVLGKRAEQEMAIVTAVWDRLLAEGGRSRPWKRFGKR